MPTRRDFLRGLGAATAGLLSKQGLTFAGQSPCPPTGAVTGSHAYPFAQIPFHPESEMISGFPFAPWFTGDSFQDIGETHITFPIARNFFEGDPPRPEETVDVAVVGGGISGLTAAYMLRDFHPVVMDLHPRLGGAAQGEMWANTAYSLGSAYVITPDPGTFLESFYQDLGLDRVVRVDQGDSEMELNGRVIDAFWSGVHRPRNERAGFLEYAELVTHMANVQYPDIPLPEEGADWIRALDQRTLKQDIEMRMTQDVPAMIASGIQAYCYSSFGAGWDEISAASGWNFLAAEEFGRWVFPGGNAYMASMLYNRIAAVEASAPSGCRGRLLRGGCKVVDVRRTGKNAQVTYVDRQGDLHSMIARRVVMACPKLACKYILHDLDAIDQPKLNAMYDLHYSAYVVVNVLLDAPIKRDFYDIFLLGDGKFPMSPSAVEAKSRVVDVLSGHFARSLQTTRSETSVLTLYWPMPWATARFYLLAWEPWRSLAEKLAPQLQEILAMLSVRPDAVRQVRMTRWAHAIPVAKPFLMSNGIIDHLRRPMDDVIYFINQDNWALPAIENCLLDAEIFVPQIMQGL